MDSGPPKHKIDTRRKWLQAAAAAFAGASVFSSPLNWWPAAAIDPPVRPTPGPLKLGLAAYSFRQALQSPADQPGSMTLLDFVDFCRQQRIAGAELTSYYFPQDPDEQYLQDLRRHCHLQGVSISGGAIRNDFCVAPEKRASELEHVRKWIDIYAAIGAPVIRIFAGSPPQGVSREEAIARCILACEEACDYAAKRGIFLALENHHGITDTAESMLQVVRGVNSDWFGVNFDSGNFRSTSDPYAELEMIAPYAINAQVKVEIFRDGKKTAADLPRILDILKSAGYGGWVVLEYEASEPAEEAIPKIVKELRPLLS